MELTNCLRGGPSWSHDRQYLYFQTFDVNNPEFGRVKVSNGKRERLASYRLSSRAGGMVLGERSYAR